MTIVTEFDRHSVSATYAKILVDMVIERGGDRDAVLEGTGLADVQLQQVDERVPAQAMVRLINNALRLTNEPALGLLYGLQLKLSAHGFLGYAAMSSETLGEAIELGVKYFKTRFGLLDVRFFREGEFAVLEMSPSVDLGGAEVFVIESFMSSFAVMGVNLLGKVPESVSSRWRFPRPSYHEILLGMLPERQVVYGADSNQIRIPAELLSHRLGLSDPASRRLAEEQCKKELALLEESESIIARVRHIILNSGQRFPKLDVVAEQCFMSGRTFKRRLQQLGTSFQEILDDIRKGQAIDYLRHTNKPIDEIAALLGYNDPSNFGRAFKRWTGKTPSQYRHHHEMMSS